MAEGRRYDVVLIVGMPDLDGLSAAQLIRQLQGDLPPPMVIMITAYGRGCWPMRATTARRPSSIFSPSRSRPSNWPTRCCMRCTANRAPRPTRRRARWAHQRLRGVRLLVVEDNALNRQVAAELLSSEGAQVALADGGLAGVQQVLEASVPFDAVLMDMQMPDIDGLEATRRIRADGRFAGLPIGHDRQRLAGRPRSLPAAGMNDHVAKPIDKERLVLCLLGHLGRSGARARRQRRRTRANWSRRGGDIVRRFGGGTELIVRCCGASFRTCRDLFAQLERQLGEAMSRAAPRPCIPSGQRCRWRQRPGRPCQRAGAGPAPRRSAARHGNPRPASASTNCAPCAMPACSACRRCSATCRRSRRAEPRRGGQSRQVQADPGSPASAAACRANNAMGVIRRYSEARPGLERHPLPVVPYLQASRSRVMGVEQGVGDFRALLQAAADGGGNRLAGLAAEPRLLLEAHADAAHAAHLAEGRGDPQADAQLFLHAPQQVFQVFQAAQGFQAAARRCSSWQRVRRRMRRSAPGASRRSRSLTQAPGGQGWRRAGKRSWHHHSGTGVPRRYAPSPSRARFSASAAPCPAAPGR